MSWSTVSNAALRSSNNNSEIQPWPDDKSKSNDYITLNESTPQDYCYKHEPRLKRKGGGVAVIYSNIFKTTKKSSFEYNSFEVLVLNVTISSINDKSRLRFVLATVYRPPGHHTDFIKEFADFLSELVLAADSIALALASVKIAIGKGGAARFCVRIFWGV